MATRVLALLPNGSLSGVGAYLEGAEEISAKINWVDYLAIGIYFAMIIIVGIVTTRRRKKDTVDSYFLAGRNMHWLPVGASLFASNIGSEHFVGLSGSGASVGIGIVGFEYNAMFVLLILGWYFMPVYLASNISTMPEYLQKRFGGQRIRIYLSLLALILYIFTKISACLFAGSLFIKLLLNLDNIYIAILILLFVSALFTILGGLTTVMWTEFVQVFFMFAGAIALAVISLIKVGGYSTLTTTFRTAGMPNETQYQSYRGGCNPETTPNCTSCSEITPYYMNLFRPASDGEVPWPGLLGMTVSGVWYWCTDQVIVQRGLSAKNLSHAKAGCIFASFMKIAPLFLLVLPGMAARMLWPNQIGCSNPDYCKAVCGSPSGCTNLAYPYLVIRLMPVGATGLMVSVIVAALMSSLTSIFNSASTIFIIDIYKRFRRAASEVEQIVVGRLFVVFLVVVSVAWVPIIESSQNSELFQYIQSVTSFLSPPVCAVYVLALFWGRTNEQGAFWSLVVGLILGLIRMILEFSIPAPACSSSEPDPRPFITKLHYLHFGIALFAISAAVAVVVSLLTKKPEEKHLYRLTYSTVTSEEVREDIDWSDDTTLEVQAKTVDLEPKKPKSNEGLSKWIWLLCCTKPEEEQPADGAENSNGYNLENEIAPEELARIHAQSAKDDPKWDWAVNLGGVLMIFVASFLWGYYA